MANCSGLTWSITGGNSAGDFAINSATGVITITANGVTDLVGDKVAQILTVQATSGGNNGSNTADITAYGDGSVGAPGGSANAAQLFSNGAAGGTGTSYSFTPPWKVAGKDYRVGYDTTIGALSDPSLGGFPACVTSTSGNTVTVGANGPCTIQKYDFSLQNGWKILITSGCASGTITIKNNNFLIGSNFGATVNVIIGVTGGGCNVDLENNVLDANGCNFGAATSAPAIASFAGTGTVTARYNQILNSPQHGLSLQQSGTGNSFVSAFNYYRVFGYGAGNHADPFIFNTSGSFSTATSKFDTIVEAGKSGDPSIVGNCPANTAIGGGAGGATGLQYFSPNVGSTLTGVVSSYNTIIASSNGTVMVSKIVSMDSGTITSPVITNNYFDVSGILSAGVPFNLPNATSPTISGNILLTNGHSCNANNNCS